MIPLKQAQDQINLMDFQIINLLSQRLQTIKQIDPTELSTISELENNLIINQAEFLKLSKSKGLPAKFARRLYRDLLHISQKITGIKGTASKPKKLTKRTQSKVKKT